ncbi:unnamed protein product, partial [Closterium sp. NIES-64]
SRALEQLAAASAAAAASLRPSLSAALKSASPRSFATSAGPNATSEGPNASSSEGPVKLLGNSDEGITNRQPAAAKSSSVSSLSVGGARAAGAAGVRSEQAARAARVAGATGVRSEMGGESDAGMHVTSTERGSAISGGGNPTSVADAVNRATSKEAAKQALRSHLLNSSPFKQRVGAAPTDATPTDATPASTMPPPTPSLPASSPLQPAQEFTVPPPFSVSSSYTAAAAAAAAAVAAAPTGTPSENASSPSSDQEASSSQEADPLSSDCFSSRFLAPSPPPPLDILRQELGGGVAEAVCSTADSIVPTETSLFLIRSLHHLNSFLLPSPPPNQLKFGGEGGRSVDEKTDRRGTGEGAGGAGVGEGGVGIRAKALVYDDVGHSAFACWAVRGKRRGRRDGEGGGGGGVVKGGVRDGVSDGEVGGGGKEEEGEWKGGMLMRSKSTRKLSQLSQQSQREGGDGGAETADGEEREEVAGQVLSSGGASDEMVCVRDCLDIVTGRVSLEDIIAVRVAREGAVLEASGEGAAAAEERAAEIAEAANGAAAAAPDGVAAEATAGAVEARAGVVEATTGAEEALIGAAETADGAAWAAGEAGSKEPTWGAGAAGMGAHSRALARYAIPQRRVLAPHPTARDSPSFPLSLTGGIHLQGPLLLVQEGKSDLAEEVTEEPRLPKPMQVDDGRVEATAVDA